MMAILAVHDGTARARMPKPGATSFLLGAWQRIRVAAKMARSGKWSAKNFQKKLSFRGFAVDWRGC
jgi:hypothetical protein